MGSIPFWDDADPAVLALLDDLSDSAGPWDSLYLAGERVPGIVVPPGGGLERSIDVKKSKGSKGAIVTYNGDDPANIEWDVLIWTPSQWSRFQDMMPLIQPRKPDEYPPPLEAGHPALALVGIKSIFFTRIGFPQIDNGVGTIGLKAVEWFPQPKPVKKPSNATPKGAPPVKKPGDVNNLGIFYDPFDPVNNSSSPVFGSADRNV
jgi:hypothetical protein